MRSFADLINAVRTADFDLFADIARRQPTLILRLNDDRENILHISVKYNAPEIFDYIVALHPDLILCRNIFGWNAFHCAIVSSNALMVQHIGYKYPTLVNKKDNLGLTAGDLLENKPRDLVIAALKVGVTTPEIEAYIKSYAELFYSEIDLPIELKNIILSFHEKLLPDEYRFITNDIDLLDTIICTYFKKLRTPIIREVAHGLAKLTMREYRKEQALPIEDYQRQYTEIRKLLHSTFRIYGYKFDWTINIELRNDIKKAMLEALNDGDRVSKELIAQSIDTWVQKVTQRQLAASIELVI